MILNEHEINVMTAHALFYRYWSENEERIREWIEDKITNEYMNERVGWDVFFEEFPFKYDEKVPFGFMVEEYMDFLGSYVISLFTDGIERNFERLVDEVMLEVETQKEERIWQEREYRRMVI